MFDTCEYHPTEIERVARRAFEIAGERSGRLTSVDKASVMETSRLWRQVVTDLAADYPGVRVDHMLADNCGMQLVLAPDQFDVIVTENTFGDLLSDVAAGVTGGLGLAASASLGDDPPGLFEPVHGSAPQIAGQGIANPAAMLRSTALLLRHGLVYNRYFRRAVAGRGLSDDLLQRGNGSRWGYSHPGQRWRSPADRCAPESRPCPSFHLPCIRRSARVQHAGASETGL